MTQPSPLFSPTAQTGFANATLYDTHRPSYLPRAVNSFLALLNLAFRNHSKILEIGAGTGKFTELLAARDEEYEVLAVEPHSEMRGVLEAKKLRGVRSEEGNAEGVGKLVKDGWADAVIIAQAFHWFATISTLRALHNALKPNGRLGMIWNIEDYNQTRSFKCHSQWEQTLKEAAWEHDDGEPRVRNDLWRNVFLSEEGQKLFGKLEEREFPVSIWIEKEDLWKRINTMSYISNLKEETKAEFRKKFDTIIDTGADVQRDDTGKILYHYTVITAVTQRK